LAIILVQATTALVAKLQGVLLVAGRWVLRPYAQTVKQKAGFVQHTNLCTHHNLYHGPV
jgi:hypothetical protein